MGGLDLARPLLCALLPIHLGHLETAQESSRHFHQCIIGGLRIALINAEDPDSLLEALIMVIMNSE